MKPAGSVAAVVAAVRDEAGAEVERVERAAAQELQAIERARTATVVQVPDRERRLAAAHLEVRDRLARQDYLDSRALLELRERWMQDVVSAGLECLASRPAAERRRVLGALADEALAMVPGERAVLEVAEVDALLLDEEWVEARKQKAGKSTVAVEAARLDGGCIVRSGDRRIAYDNSLAARVERFESRWRLVLGAIFEEAAR